MTSYQRGWFHQFADHVGSTCTYLGAVAAKGKTINGAIYRVADFESTRQRETGYTATPLKAGEITMLDGGDPMETGGAARVYIFVSNEDSVSRTREPTPRFPMVNLMSTAVYQWLPGTRVLYRTAKGFTRNLFARAQDERESVNGRIYPYADHSFMLHNAPP